LHRHSHAGQFEGVRCQRRAVRRLQGFEASDRSGEIAASEANADPGDACVLVGGNERERCCGIATSLEDARADVEQRPAHVGTHRLGLVYSRRELVERFETGRA